MGAPFLQLLLYSGSRVCGCFLHFICELTLDLYFISGLTPNLHFFWATRNSESPRRTVGEKVLYQNRPPGRYSRKRSASAGPK